MEQRIVREIEVAELDFVDWVNVKPGDVVEIRVNGKPVNQGLIMRNGKMGMARPGCAFLRAVADACHADWPEEARRAWERERDERGGS